MAPLVYHPAYDPYGSVLRSVQFLSVVEEPVAEEQLRLFDFLLLFPEFISSFRLSTPLRSKLKKIRYRQRFRYEERPPATRLFSEMELSFGAALQTLISKGIVKRRVGGSVQLDGVATPARLGALAAKRNAESQSLLDYLVELNSSFSFYGPDGLKARSGLLEYRYDVV